MRKKRNKSKKVSVLAFLIAGRLGLIHITSWRIGVAPFSAMLSLDTVKTYHHHPNTLYRSGNGDDAKEGGAELRKYRLAYRSVTSKVSSFLTRTVRTTTLGPTPTVTLRRSGP
jgi:hypothetical protein